MVRKGNLAVFESSGISETGESMPTKIGVHALNVLMTMDYSPWSEREIWPFLRIAVSPKPESPCPQKLVYMHVTSIPTCMNILS